MIECFDHKEKPSSFQRHSVCYHKQVKLWCKNGIFSPEFFPSLTLWWWPSCPHMRTDLISVLWGQPILSSSDCVVIRLISLYSVDLGNICLVLKLTFCEERFSFQHWKVSLFVYLLPLWYEWMFVFMGCVKTNEPNHLHQESTTQRIAK